MGEQSRNRPGPGLGSEGLNWSREAVRVGCLPNPYVQEVDSIKGHITGPSEPPVLQRGWMHQGVAFPLSETQLYLGGNTAKTCNGQQGRFQIGKGRNSQMK